MIHVEEQSFFNDNVEGLVLEPGHPPHICPNPSQVWKALALEFDDLPESAQGVEDVWRQNMVELGPCIKLVAHHHFASHPNP